MSAANTYNNILGNIESLQKIQEQLNLELNSLSPNAGLDRQKLLVSQIDMINARKTDLFKNLYSVSNIVNKNINVSTDDLKSKQAIVQLLQNRVKEAERKEQQIKDENINNLRMTQINSYYSGYYAKYMKIFQLITYTCIGIIIVTLLRQRGVISPALTNILAGIVLFIGGCHIVIQLYDLNRRNNLEINEYDFNLSIKEADLPDDTDKIDPLGGYISGLGQYQKDLEMLEDGDIKNDLEMLQEGDCIGENCCSSPGLVFDSQTKKCKSNTTEGFTPLNPAPVHSYHSSSDTNLVYNGSCTDVYSS